MRQIMTISPDAHSPVKHKRHSLPLNHIGAHFPSIEIVPEIDITHFSDSSRRSSMASVNSTHTTHTTHYAASTHTTLNSTVLSDEDTESEEELNIDVGADEIFSMRSWGSPSPVPPIRRRQSTPPLHVRRANLVRTNTKEVWEETEMEDLEDEMKRELRHLHSNSLGLVGLDLSGLGGLRSLRTRGHSVGDRDDLDGRQTPTNLISSTSAELWDAREVDEQADEIRAHLTRLAEQQSFEH